MYKNKYRHLWQSDGGRGLFEIEVVRTYDFNGEPGWAVREGLVIRPSMSDVEQERLAILSLLEPGEECEGVGRRSRIYPHLFFVARDREADAGWKEVMRS